VLPFGTGGVVPGMRSMDLDLVPERFSRPLRIDEITPEAVTERLSYALRRLVGPARRWSYAELSGKSAIDIRTIKSYVQGTACPNLVRFKRLVAVLGPEVCLTLDTMTGWLPRSDATPPEALDLAALWSQLVRAIEILSTLVDNAPERCEEACLEGAGGERHVVAAASLLRETGFCSNGRPALPRKDTDQRPLETCETLSDFLAPLKVQRINDKAVSRRLSYRLTRMIGAGGSWSLADVAQSTGIDRRTLLSYMDGAAIPNLARYFRLEAVMGPEVGIELARMLGWQPRYGHPPAAGIDELARLRACLVDSAELVDGLLHRSGSRGSSNLIWRADQQRHRRRLDS